MRIAAAALALVLAACGPRAASAPDPSLAPIPSTITRAAAITLVRNDDFSVGRVDRAEAKLMSYAEYVRIAGPVRAHSGDPSATSMTGFGIIGDPAKRYVWVVAVAGEVYPNGKVPISFGHPLPGSPTPYPPYRWGIYLVESVRGDLMAIGDAGAADAWPAIFAALPDHPATVYSAPSPTAALTTIVVQHFAPEATTAVMRRVRHIDRLEVKLMTWAEYVASGDPLARKPDGVADAAPVWIVAVSGEDVPDLARGTTARWGIWAIDPSDESVRATVAGTDAAWPSFFDRLPDHPTQGP